MYRIGLFTSLGFLGERKTVLCQFTRFQIGCFRKQLQHSTIFNFNITFHATFIYFNIVQNYCDTKTVLNVIYQRLLSFTPWSTTRHLLSVTAIPVSKYNNVITNGQLQLNTRNRIWKERSCCNSAVERSLIWVRPPGKIIRKTKWDRRVALQSSI